MCLTYVVDRVGFEPTSRLMSSSTIKILPILPSLHPHSLTRVVSCLCPTDFYTEWQSYRTLWFTPLMALLHCGERASTSVVISLDYIYIIPHLSGFVKGFLKSFSKIFDGLLYSSVQGVEPFASCGTRCHLASPLLTLLLYHKFPHLSSTFSKIIIVNFLTICARAASRRDQLAGSLGSEARPPTT